MVGLALREEGKEVGEVLGWVGNGEEREKDFPFMNQGILRWNSKEI